MLKDFGQERFGTLLLGVGEQDFRRGLFNDLTGIHQDGPVGGGAKVWAKAELAVIRTARAASVVSMGIPSKDEGTMRQSFELRNRAFSS